jgi:hypothetical protein
MSGPTVAIMMLGLLAAGCGWSPSGSIASNPGCAESDSPTKDTVDSAINQLPGATWKQSARGNTPDCQLQWVVVTSGDAADSPQQVLFFDRNTAIGSPTPDPRPYISVAALGNSIASVQYQWRQNGEPACCPTGIGNVRMKIDNGKLSALDPIPNA